MVLVGGGGCISGFKERLHEGMMKTIPTEGKYQSLEKVILSYWKFAESPFNPLILEWIGASIASEFQIILGNKVQKPNSHKE